MRLMINGTEVSPDLVCFNSGMNFGQFWRTEEAGARIGPYEMRFTRAEFIDIVRADYDVACREVREDDLHDTLDEVPSPFFEIDYGGIEVALAHPRVLFEIVEGFLIRDTIFAHVLSYDSSTWRYLLNSIDTVVVEGDDVILSGRYL